MSNVAAIRDIGSLLAARAAFDPVPVLASGSTTNGVEVTGYIIDRQADAFGGLLLSAKVIIQYTTVMASTSGTTVNAIITSNVQDSATTASTAFADYDNIDEDGPAAVTVAGTTVNGGAVIDTLSYDMSLGGAARYVRVQVTATLAGSSTSADLVNIAGVWVFAGSDQPPPA